MNQQGLRLRCANRSYAMTVHVEQDDTIRIISMRKADRYETELFYQNAGYF